MSPVVYIVIALLSGFAFGYLVDYHLSSRRIAEANVRADMAKDRADKADSRANQAIAAEKKRLEAEYAQQAVEFENRLMRDPDREKELELLRRDNAKLNHELRKHESALYQSSVSQPQRNDSQNRDAVSELSSLRAECDQANMRYELLKKSYYKEKSLRESAESDLAAIHSELNAAISARDQAHSQLDDYKQRVEDIQYAWCKDASERDALLDKANLDHAAQLERRRDQQFEMLQQVREASYAPEVKSRLCAALESVSIPDMSLGAVYVKRDLSSNTYHHAVYCTDDLVLASKVFVQKAGFRPCACCAVAPAPDYDETVFRSSFSSRKYHRFECQHMFTSDPSTHKAMTVTDALRLGLVPCKACKPPEESPYRVFF